MKRQKSKLRGAAHNNIAFNRWQILAVLFLARFAMAVQFQEIGALSAPIIKHYQMSLADIGLLIGLYLAPGIIIAIPGASMAIRFGEKPIVTFGFLLMLLGGFISIMFNEGDNFFFGRLIAGSGGVILNIVMTKMVVDWFAGREISTAMAIFVNSWPAGIAFALLVLPILESSGGLSLAHLFILSFIAFALALFVIFYRPPAKIETLNKSRKASKLPIYALSLISIIWALYNASLAMIFSFGPLILGNAGWSSTQAGLVISAFMGVFTFALPLGGILADRTKIAGKIICFSLLSFILLMPLSLHVSQGWLVVLFLLVGCCFAFAAGPIMALPATILHEDTRTFGMGIFFTVYYVVMLGAPKIAGSLADKYVRVEATLYIGAFMCLICLGALALFYRNIKK